MNFLCDLTASQPNSDGDFHGGGKYAKKIFLALIEKVHPGLNIFALYDSSKNLDNELKNAAVNNSIPLINIHNNRLDGLIKEYNINRLYTALPFNLIKYGLFDSFKQDCKIYGTIHGLRTLETPMGISSLKYFISLKEKVKALVKILGKKYFLRRDIIRYKQLFSKMIIFTVSEHSKYSLLTYFPELKTNVNVFYSPDVTEFEDKLEDQRNGSFNLSNYFLLVSGNRWIKNNLMSAIAIDELLSERPEITQNVIIAGVSNPALFLNKIKNKERFTFYGYVSESFLKKLYENAYAFIYMTLNEGFGYPPLEAMKLGTPTITSPFTSIPEICGDAVLYSNPFSVQEIKNRILQICNTENHDLLSNEVKNRYALINSRQQKDLNSMINFLLN